MSRFESEESCSWEIKNVTLLENDTIYSPLFNVTGPDDFKQREWCFKLTLGKISREFSNLNLSLVVVTGPRISFSRSSITVRDAVEKLDIPPPGEVLAGKEEMVGVIKYSHKNYDLISEGSILTDVLQITCVFHPRESEEASAIPDKDLEKLSSDFNLLFESGNLSDLHIKAGEEVFKVHKIILHTRCPELLKDLKEDTIDKSVVDTITSDVDPAVLKALLAYLYSGKLIVDNSNLFAGLHFALEDYELDSLKKLVCFAPSTHLAETFIPTNRACIIWPIENFSSLKPEQKVFSPLVFIGIEIFQLAVMLSKDSKDVKIFLYRNSRVVQKIFCACLVTVILVDGKSEPYFQRHHYEEEREWCLPNILKRKWLHDNSDETLPNDTLTLRCDIAFPTGEQINTTRTIISTVKSYPQEYCDLSKLSKDFMTIKNNLNKSDMKKFSDIELYLKNETLYAHKAILFSRSPELAEMTASESGVETMHKLDLKNEETYAVHSVLHYAYTGKFLDCDNEQIFAIYTLAKTLKFSDLESCCFSRLHSCINFNSATEILKIAYLHSDESLKAYVKEYILEHPREILVTNEWMGLLKENPDLISDMYVFLAEQFRKVILNASFEDLYKAQQKIN